MTLWMIRCLNPLRTLKWFIRMGTVLLFGYGLLLIWTFISATDPLHHDYGRSMDRWKRNSHDIKMRHPHVHSHYSEMESNHHSSLNLPSNFSQSINTSMAFSIEIVNPRHIFFNRVPKCGSTSIKAILKSLSRYNQWHMQASTIFNKERVSENEQKEVVKAFYNLTSPSLFERHINFINFTRFGYENPFYINVVREPFERLVSDYYFLRYELSYMFPMNETRRKRTYDECVQGEYAECIADKPTGYYRIIPFFCGQQHFCRSPSEESLHEAMRNVNQYYSLVGVSEDLQGFFEILEYIAPSFFRTASKTYKHKAEYLKRITKSKKKIPPQEKTREIMKHKLKYDYEFYHFIQQKFQATLNKVRYEKSRI